jgi:uncharacterized membrane protein YcaP (DUF421 family)
VDDIRDDMNPLRIGIRCLVAYLFLLVMLRLAGKRAVYHGDPFDLVLALVFGDLIDDAIWAEVPMAQFIVATMTMALMKLTLTLHKARG